MNARVPAEVFAPGEFLKEELDARDWSQIELAEILGRPARVVSEIISGKRAITPETAKGLAAALGTSAELWMNLETAYQLSKAKIEDSEVSRRAKLYGKFPVKEMLKRGWIETSNNLDVLEKRFLDFFGLKSLDEPVGAINHAAKKTSYEGSSPIQRAWLYRARQIAKIVSVGKFSAEKLKEVVGELQGRREFTDAVREVPAILAKAGIRFVIVEPLPGSKMDGACFWLDGKHPVIAMSLRYDRIDNFWHVLFHEMDHLAHGEGKDEPIVDEIDPGKAWNDLPKIEQRANESAAAHCIDQDELSGFIARVNPVYSETQIVGFARRLQIHPGLVVGQLQHRGLIPWSFHKKFLEKVRAIVTPVAMTDGFGNKLSV